MSRPRVVVVGDVVLDRDISGGAERVCPDSPAVVVDVDTVWERPGGAGLAAQLCAAGDIDVTLVAPLATDEPGRRLAAMLSSDLTVLPLGHQGATRQKSRVLSGGQVVVRIDEGGPGTPLGAACDDVLPVLKAADVVLVSDYGAGVTHDAGLRDMVGEAARHVPVVWDPHPRGGEPLPGSLVTPNLREARGVARRHGLPADGPVETLAAALCAHWQAAAVCVTVGSNGAYFATPGCEPVLVAAPFAVVGDACGAGDRFVASVVYGLSQGQLMSEAMTAAVSDASLWVAAGGFRALPCPADRNNHGRAGEVVADVRRRGGIVVAAGGCFDIVHVGHVAYLEAARRLGDALVVLVNSDESVRRLKGPGRPVVNAADRARVLLSLGCVDAVEVFDDDDPRAALAGLRPDVWVKGGDYGGVAMREEDLVKGWGGRVVLVPYVDGHSTTSIVQRSVQGPGRGTTWRLRERHA